MFPSSWSSLGTPKHVAVYLCNNYNGTLYYFSNSVTNSLNLNNITWNPNWNTGNYVQTSQSSFTPQRGDLICFHWGSGSFSWDHIGIVTAVNGSTVYYTDGNTGYGSSYTTRTVIVGHSISRSSSEIIGYIRPNYSKSSSVTYTLDVNGYLDENDYGENTTGYGTFDVYVNGSLVANDTTDYCEHWPYGTTYEIADIRAASGKTYLGVTQGSKSGTITGETKIQLHFSTPYSGGSRVIPDGKYRIISAQDSRYAIGIPSYSSTNGDNVQLYQWSDNDPTSTVFDIKYIGDGFYTINSSYAEYFALNCAARGTKKGTNVIVWDYDPANTQLWAQWAFFLTGNGTYNIIARHCGLFLEASVGVAAGSNLQLNIGYGSGTEQFYLEPVLVNSIKVTFDANGSKVSPSSQSVTWEGMYGTLPKPTRSGYRFGGWYTKASGGTLVKADTTVTKTYDHTLYAHWTKVESQSEENMTGWQKEDGKWYYYNTDGERLTGWQKISGDWYYFNESGAMVTGTQTINGKTYTFSNSGVWAG